MATVARAVLEGDQGTLEAFSSSLAAGPASALESVRSRRPLSADPHTFTLLEEVVRSAEASPTSPDSLAAMLKTALTVKGALAASRRDATLVWTGPEVHESAFRTTAQTIAELVEGAQSQILMSTYSLRATGRPPAGSLVGQLARARHRGVHVTLVLHQNDENRRALLQPWPSWTPPPRVLTWPIPDGDEMVKLHAKIVAVDDRWLLISSANLTYHGFFANLEMGVLLHGRIAGEVRRHFDRLERYGHLAEWS
jgi:phosphatidylserine/phosphatidylglycerophosphate/cardiolipin synthase-like enzyme